MSLWSKLPDDIVKLIYEYDSTYREIMNESLKFIEHACPTCCCDGKKNRYRHHYDIGTFAFTFGIGNGDAEMLVQNIILVILTKMEIKQHTTGEKWNTIFTSYSLSTYKFTMFLI